MLTVSASVRLTVWANAFLTGHASPDEASDAIRRGDVAHQVVGLPGHDQPVSLPIALHALRRSDVRACSLALPAPGDPLGLAGPPAFNEIATEAGQAVIAHNAAAGVLPGHDFGGNLGLVPVPVGPAVQWVCHRAVAPPVTDLAQADRDLRGGLLRIAGALVDTDAGAWRPELADELIEIRAIGSGTDDALAPGYSATATALSVRARRLLALAQAALDDGSTAVTRQAADARRDAVMQLDALARRVLVSACSCPPSS